MQCSPMDENDETGRVRGGSVCTKLNRSIRICLQYSTTCLPCSVYTPCTHKARYVAAGRAAGSGVVPPSIIGIDANSLMRA